MEETWREVLKEVLEDVKDAKAGMDDQLHLTKRELFLGAAAVFMTGVVGGMRMAAKLHRPPKGCPRPGVPGPACPPPEPGCPHPHGEREEGSCRKNRKNRRCGR